MYFSLLITSLIALVLPYLASTMSSPPPSPIYILFEGKIPSPQSALATHFYTTLSHLVVSQPGFISQTPFLSIDQEGGQVLYVKFDSAEHLRAWKNHPTHLAIQDKGRRDVFVDYRLRVGVEFDGLGGNGNGTENVGKYLLVWRYTTNATDSCMTPSTHPPVWRALVDAATYTSDTHTLRLSSWSDDSTAMQVRDNVPRVQGDEVRLIWVQRDYGRFQREEVSGAWWVGVGMLS